MFIPVLLFGLGLLLLIKGGDWFVEGATGIAHRFGVPELLIGATVVSIGTTLPEVMVSATSAVGGHGELAYGNAIGSIICNTALIAALTIAIRPSKVDRKSLSTPVVFFFLAAAVYLYRAYVSGSFSRAVGLELLGIFAVYMILTIRQAFRNPAPVTREAELGDGPTWKSLLLLAVGAILIAIGADLLVDNGTLIAQAMGVPESVTAITSLAKGHGALSLGNIVGANLFNLVLVSGISVTLAPFDLPASKTIGGYNASLVVDLPVMMLVMSLLTLPALVKGKLTRGQGVLLLCIYGAFCVFQFFL